MKPSPYMDRAIPPPHDRDRLIRLTTELATASPFYFGYDIADRFSETFDEFLGSVGKPVGLAAALLFRGIRYIEVPTTFTHLTDGCLSNKFLESYPAREKPSRPRKLSGA